MPVVGNAVYVDGRRRAAPETVESTVEELRASPGGRSFCWIGLLNPDEEELHRVATQFGLHPLTVQDTISAHQRPKIERYGETMFVVLRPAWYVDPVEVVEIGEVQLFVGPDFVITVRHAPQPDLGEIRRTLEDRVDLLGSGPDAVLHAVLDKVVDDYRPVVDGVQNDVDEIEVQVFNGAPEASQRIYQLTREVIEFQRAVEPLRDVLDQLRSTLNERTDTPGLELRRALRTVDDHLTRVDERLKAIRDLLTNILIANSALVAQRQNDEMARLTAAGFEQNEQVKRISSWAAIFFAPTLVASVYGMNFVHMPELTWTLGYPFALLMMVLFGAGLFLVFRRRNWL